MRARFPERWVLGHVELRKEFGSPRLWPYCRLCREAPVEVLVHAGQAGKAIAAPAAVAPPRAPT
eukprot:4030265-Lingulodinium_polyedra.AAC.1